MAPTGEPGKTAPLAQCANTLAAPGQDFVGISLMTDIPDQAVVRRVENIVKGDGEFHHAEPGPEMTTGLRHGIDHFGAEFRGKLEQIALRQHAKVRRYLHPVKQGGWNFTAQHSPRPAWAR